MENFSTPLFLELWQQFAAVPRPENDTPGYPENSRCVLEYYDSHTQILIRKLVQMGVDALFRLDSVGYFVQNRWTTNALEQQGFDVSFELAAPGEGRISACIARDDRCLALTLVNSVEASDDAPALCFIRPTWRPTWHR